jgi:hypothetical protein
MSVENQLVDPEYYIDGVLIAIVPGSYKPTVAPGEIKTRVMAAGSNRTLVRGVDNESNLDKHSLSIATTDVNKQRVKNWKNRSLNADYFVVKAVFPNGDRADDVLKYASLDNMIEAEHSAEGNIELEFTGLSSGE